MKTKQRKSESPVEVIDTAALCWPIEPEPQPMNISEKREGKPWGSLLVGWWINAYCAIGSTGSVYNAIGQGCTNSVHHSTWSTTKTDSQNCGRFYATKKDAILALRWEVCRKFAKTLSQIDKMDTTEPTQ